MMKDGPRDFDRIVREQLRQFVRRAFQRRKALRDLLANFGFNMLDQAGQDLIDQRAHLGRQFAVAFEQHSGDAVEQRAARKAGTVFRQRLQIE